MTRSGGQNSEVARLRALLEDTFTDFRSVDLNEVTLGLVIAYRIGADLWVVSFEETAEDGMLRIRVQPGDAAKVMSIADLRAALDLLEARHR